MQLRYCYSADFLDGMKVDDSLCSEVCASVYKSMCGAANSPFYSVYELTCKRLL